MGRRSRSSAGAAARSTPRSRRRTRRAARSRFAWSPRATASSPSGHVERARRGRPRHRRRVDGAGERALLRPRRARRRGRASRRSASRATSPTGRGCRPTGRRVGDPAAARASAPRDDATYFPIPWILSSRGYGLLVDNDETAYHALATPDRPTRGASRSSARRTAWPSSPDRRRSASASSRGRGPPTCCARFTAAVGRQPKPAAPWVFGPWFQGDGRSELARDARRARVGRADVLPLPAVRRRPARAEPRAHERAHDARLRDHDVLQPDDLHVDISRRTTRRSPRARSRGSADGTPYVYRYFTSRFFDVSQFDFSARGGPRCLRRASSR